MRAQIGDRIVLGGIHVRDGEVLEVRGPDGEPPFLVRFEDDEHEVLLFPVRDWTLVRSGHQVTDGDGTDDNER
jgi:Domain of unknown function (DUF1918)